MALLKNITMIMTMSCKHASRLLSKQQDHPLTTSERLALSLHLLICRFCRRYRKQLRIMDHHMHALEEQITSEPLPPDKREELVKTIVQKLDNE